MDALDDLDLAWLAGLLEGEGCFYWCRSYAGGANHPAMEVTMTDLDVVERASRLLGNRAIRKVKPASDRHQVQYRVRLRGAAAREVMQMILPHMGNRRSARIREILI